MLLYIPFLQFSEATSLSFDADLTVAGLAAPITLLTLSHILRGGYEFHADLCAASQSGLSVRRPVFKLLGFLLVQWESPDSCRSRRKIDPLQVDQSNLAIVLRMVVIDEILRVGDGRPNRRASHSF